MKGKSTVTALAETWWKQFQSMALVLTLQTMPRSNGLLDKVWVSAFW